MTGKQKKTVVSNDETLLSAEKAQTEAGEEQIEPRTTKIARNKRKKENAKKNKQEAAAKLKQDEDVLAAAAAASAKEVLERKRNKHLCDLSTSHSLKIKTSTIRGLGLFALKSFAASTAILHESPLLPIIQSNSILLKEASLTLSPADKQSVFLSLHGHCSCRPAPCPETPFMKIWNDNAFAPPEFRYTCVYEVASRLNHSCTPNATIRFTSSQDLIIRTSRPIAEGDEITINYSGYKGGDRKSRRAMLQKKYGFTCRCSACLLKKDLPILPEPIIHLLEESCTSAKVINKPTMASQSIVRKIIQWSRVLDLILRAAVDSFMEEHAHEIAMRMHAGRPYDNFNDDLADSVVRGVWKMLKDANVVKLSEESVNKYIYGLRERFEVGIERKTPIAFVQLMVECLEGDFEIEEA